MCDDEFGPISLMVHLAQSSHPIYESNLGNKVGLLEASIMSDLSYINEYEFGPHEIQSWLGLIKMLGSFSYKDQQNIIPEKEIRSLLSRLFRIIFSNK